MSRLPPLRPSDAGLVLRLLEHAQARCPSAPLAWLQGYCEQRAGDPVGPVGRDGASGPVIAETERALRESLPPSASGVR